MNRYRLLVFLSLFWGITSAQVTITGLLTDSLSGNPVPDANILVRGTFNGTSSDEHGRFLIRVNKLPVRLVVSEIRHYTTDFLIRDSIIRITIAPKIPMLSGVTISGEKIKNIHPDDRYYAFDFEFYGDYIFCLAYQKTRKKSTLFVIDQEGKLILRKPLQVVPDRLYCDFAGNVHLLTADSAYQLYYDHVDLYLLYPWELYQFLGVMNPCKASYKGKLLMQKPDYQGLINNYFAVGKENKTLFYSIEDSTKMSYLRREYDLKYFLNLRNMGVEGYGYSVKTIRENLDMFRLTVAYDWMDSKILSPVFAPLFNINDTICIFDFTHSEAVRFDSNLQVEMKIPITFHQDKKWNRTILLDNTWKDVYACYLRNGITEICRLDRNNFTPVTTTRLDGMTFIDKIRINNGCAFFLYKDFHLNTSRMIYKAYL